MFHNAQVDTGLAALNERADSFLQAEMAKGEASKYGFRPQVKVTKEKLQTSQQVKRRILEICRASLNENPDLRWFNDPLLEQFEINETFSRSCFVFLFSWVPPTTIDPPPPPPGDVVEPPIVINPVPTTPITIDPPSTPTPIIPPLPDTPPPTFEILPSWDVQDEGEEEEEEEDSLADHQGPQAAGVGERHFYG